MTTGVGVLGFGFMGRTHLQAYRAAVRDGLPCRIVAIASLSGVDAGGHASGNLNIGSDIDLSGVRTAEHAHALADDPDIHLVSICTPTDTHLELAAMMLRAGKHVLVEKPVALYPEHVRQLGTIAREHNRLCMAGMCMRFWPGWDWLKSRVEDRSHGQVRSATFTRLGSRPGWSPEFYRDASRCGGAIFDLHLHDSDIIYWLFGPPDEVASTGTLDHVTTLYRYSRGPAHVAAEGGWLETPAFPFRMRYTVEFDTAVADWDLSRPDRLLLTQNGKTAPVAIPEGAGYDGEIRALLRAIETGASDIAPGMHESAEVVALVHAERQSLMAGRPVTFRR